MNFWDFFWDRILPIGAILLAIFLFYLAKKDKRLRYTFKEIKVLTPDVHFPSALKFSFNGQEINSLVLTIVYIWNAGRGTIDKTDVVLTAPVKLLIPDGSEVLGIEKEDAGEGVNRFEVQKAEGGYLLDFDYLDYKDGCMIKIFHSGSLEGKITVGGKIKGGSLKRFILPKETFIARIAWIFAFLFFVILVINSYTGWPGKELMAYYQKHNSLVFKIIFCAITFFLIIWPKIYQPLFFPKKFYSDDYQNPLAGERKS